MDTGPNDSRWFRSARRQSSDTDTTADTLTNFLNLSGTQSSQGRSSTGSIPWAEDAIRQNQLEWEHIERIFYGEEALPEDQKTREEFQDWMETFLYLRVVGRKVNTERFRTNRNPIYHEETIAIDPGTRYTNTGLQRRPKETPISLNPILGTRSGHILTRRYVCDCDDARQHETDLPTVNNPVDLATSRNGPVENHQSHHLLTARSGYELKANSANLLRLPRVLTSKCRSQPKLMKPSPLKSTSTLPLLNVGKLTLGDLLTTRSISAFNRPTDDVAKRKG